MKQFFAPIVVLFIATSAFAQSSERVARQTRIAKQSATITGDRGLFTVPSVETLNKGQFSFGAAWSNTDRSPRDIDINSFPVYFSYGVLGRLTVSGAFETQRQVTARNLAQRGFNSAVPFVADTFTKGYGDTIIGAKYRFQRRKDNVGGLSFKGFVKIGTADPNKGLGTGRTDVGADVIFSSLLPLSFLLHSTMAYTATSDTKEPRVVGIKDELRSGLGAAWPASGIDIGKGTLQGIFEYATVTYVGAGSPNDAKTKQNPSDVAAGIRYLMLDHGITIDAGYRNNVKFDFSFPNTRNRHGLTFGVSYTKPVMIASGTNHFPVIALESDSDEISAGGSATITATGYDADKDPLTYQWSTSGGQIVGSGEKVTFNASGVAPGKYTVRARATDGKGGVATSLIEITVK